MNEISLTYFFFSSCVELYDLKVFKGRNKKQMRKCVRYEFLFLPTVTFWFRTFKQTTSNFLLAMFGTSFRIHFLRFVSRGRWLHMISIFLSFRLLKLNMVSFNSLESKLMEVLVGIPTCAQREKLTWILIKTADLNLERSGKRLEHQ